MDQPTRTTRRRPRIQAATTGVAVLVLALAGCGSDAEGSAGSTSAPATSSTAPAASLEEFVAAGNAACVRFGTAVEAAFPDFEGEPTLPEVKKLGADLAPLFRSFRDEVAGLDAPEDKAGDVEALLDELDSTIEALDAMTSDDGAEAALADGGPPIDAANEAAVVLFDRCAQ